jgi:AraC-like DNA-binding protein
MWEETMSQRDHRRPLRRQAVRVEQVLAVLRAQAFRRDVSEITIGAACRLSQRAVSRAIHATGTSLRQHIKEIRVERARELLLARQVPIKVIAIDLGFRWPQDFSRVFREIVGLSPSAFRAQRAAAQR